MKRFTIIRTYEVVLISFFVLLSIGCDSGSSGTGSNTDNAPGIAMSGITGPETIDGNIVVPRNTITTFNGTTVKGNVTVQQNAQFFANGARIEGNVQAYSADLVDLGQQTLIDGDMQGEKTRSVIVRDGTVVGGNVQITEAVSPENEDSLLLENATVKGDVQAEKSSGRLRVYDSLIFGNLQFVENKTGLYEVTGNDIDGDLQFFKNQGAGTITDNRVGGNLQSKENNPPPTISGNVVEGDLEIESGENGGSGIDNGANDNLSEVKGPETIDDNFTVKENTIVTFNGTTVKGNVTVMKNAQFFANGASIAGNVQAYEAYLVDLGQQTFIDGDVQGEKTRSVIVRDGTVVGGNVQITEAVSPENVDALLVDNAEVDGDVQAEKSSGRLRVYDSLIFGNLQFVENKTGLYEVTGNDIDGDLQFFKNQGAGTITDNRVGGNLQSKENNPPPTISGNVVEGDLEIE